MDGRALAPECHSALSFPKRSTHGRRVPVDFMRCEHQTVLPVLQFAYTTELSLSLSLAVKTTTIRPTLQLCTARVRPSDGGEETEELGCYRCRHRTRGPQA